MDKGSIVAIALAAFAAGVAVMSALRGAPPTPAGPARAGAPGPGGEPGPAVPGGAEGPDGAVAQQAADTAELTHYVGELMKAFGQLRERVEALEAKAGVEPGDDAGGAGVPGSFGTGYDPDTGQEYDKEPVWVPDGLGATAMQQLRDGAMEVLGRKAGDWRKLFRSRIRAALERAGTRGVSANTVLVNWESVVREFAAAWQDREAESLEAFCDLVAGHVVPVQLLAMDEWEKGGKQGTMSIIEPLRVPAGSDYLRDKYTEMRSALRKEWRAFFAGLPPEVQASYGSWASDFLKGKD